MAQSLYARLADRGFPTWDVSGQSGQGALQDATAPPSSVGQPNTPWTDPNKDPGYQPTGSPPPEEYQLGLTLWGLGGSNNPDDTPRGHAAPLIDPSLATMNSTLPLAYMESDAAKSLEFTGVVLTHPSSGDSWVGTQAQMEYERELVPGNGQVILADVPDQLKGNAPFDAVQGFGGGGDGPGGTNANMPLTYQDTEFPGPEGQVTFVSAAEVPFIVPNADQFIPTDPALGVWSPPYSAPTATVQQPVGAPTDQQNLGNSFVSSSTNDLVGAGSSSFWLA